MVISLPSPLGVPVIPTLFLLSSFATSSCTISRVVAVLKGDFDKNKDKSHQTTSSDDTASSVSSATRAIDSKRGGQDKTTVKTENSGTPPGHTSIIAARDICAQTTTVTSYYTSGQ
ncbi:hypothetical protein EV424DRAFT_487005 [Suillus variegatus]|nr:hypothetical protein EV424DRAFT_487005 [Suillus variegatus]